VRLRGWRAVRLGGAGEVRGPSPRIVKDRISIYPALSGPDIDGGPQYVYSPTPSVSGVPASVQYVETGEVEDLNRVSQVNWYKVVFTSQSSPNLRDKIVWVEQGVTHNLIIAAIPPSEAGRGSCFIVRAHEYL
jgi:hypothetical protein